MNARCVYKKKSLQKITYNADLIELDDATPKASTYVRCHCNTDLCNVARTFSEYTDHLSMLHSLNTQEARIEATF